MATFTDNELKMLAVNAMGRSSEMGVYVGEKLGFAGTTDRQNRAHPVANSGYSLGYYQLDFGNYDRGQTARTVVETYNRSVPENHRFSNVDDVTRQLRLHGSPRPNRSDPGDLFLEGRPDFRTTDEGRKLNAFLVTPEGHRLNQQLMNQHYDINLKPALDRFVQTPAIISMSNDDARITLAALIKLQNQRGSIDPSPRNRNISDLLNNSNTTKEDILNTINQNYRAEYIRVGQEHTLSGANLFNTLSNDTGSMGSMFRSQITVDPTLREGDFSSNPSVQILDAMFRHPAGGQRLIQAVNNGQSYQIDNHNNRIKDEAYTVGVTKEGTLYAVDKNGRGFSQPRGGQWQELNDLRELGGVTWGNREVTPPSQNRAELNASPEAMKPSEPLKPYMKNYRPMLANRSKPQGQVNLLTVWWLNAPINV